MRFLFVPIRCLLCQTCSWIRTPFVYRQAPNNAFRAPRAVVQETNYGMQTWGDNVQFGMVVIQCGIAAVRTLFDALGSTRSYHLDSNSQPRLAGTERCSTGDEAPGDDLRFGMVVIRCRIAAVRTLFTALGSTRCYLFDSNSRQRLAGTERCATWYRRRTPFVYRQALNSVRLSPSSEQCLVDTERHSTTSLCRDTMSVVLKL